MTREDRSYGLFSKILDRSQVMRCISLQKDMAKYNKEYYLSLKSYLEALKRNKGDKTNPEVTKSGELLNRVGVKVRKTGAALNDLPRDIRAAADKETDFQYRKEYLYYTHLCRELNS
jgi:hypothetical protein